MTIRLETNCLQIEAAVPDLRAACDEFERLLGAGPIEQEVVARISGVVLDIDHRGCGDAVFQFCQPLIDDIPAAHELRRIGPCLTNLTFYVADAAAAHELLTSAGATTRARWRTTPGPWLDHMGEGNARPAESLADGFFMGTRHLFGFDFEFSEPPWLDPAHQQWVHPAFTHPRPDVGDRVERLVRLRAVVDDVDHHVGNLLALIDDRDRTDVYGERADRAGRRARIALRGLELEYVQPGPSAPLRDELDRFGPGLKTAVFAVADPEAWEARSFRRREVLGFDIELVAVDEEEPWNR